MWSLDMFKYKSGIVGSNENQRLNDTFLLRVNFKNKWK